MVYSALAGRRAGHSGRRLHWCSNFLLCKTIRDCLEDWRLLDRLLGLHRSCIASRLNTDVNKILHHHSQTSFRSSHPHTGEKSGPYFFCVQNNNLERPHYISLIHHQHKNSASSYRLPCRSLPLQSVRSERDSNNAVR